MKTVNGKYASAKVFTDNIEDKATEQILTLCNQSFVDGCKIRIMPDVHAGSGCVIGFTANLGKKVIPNIVGVDIGCGMLVAELGIEHIDPEKLDKVIRERVPAGMNVHESQKMSGAFLSQLDCKDSLHNVDWILRSMGTLGGGNHFIELDEDEEKNQYLVIHTGSRNLGKQVAEYHQSVAISNLKGKNKRKDATERLIAELKAQGREQEISQKIKELDVQFPDIPNDLCYLEGKERDSYLNDINLFLFFPLHHKLVHNGINHLSCHCWLINSVKNLNIDQLCPHHFSDIEKWNCNCCTTGNNQVWLFLMQYIPRNFGILNECFNTAVCWKIAWINLFPFQKASRIFLIKSHPKAIFVLPKWLQHIKVGQMAAR